MNNWKAKVNGVKLRKLIDDFDGEVKQGADIINEMRNILDEHKDWSDEVADFLFLLDGEDEKFFQELENEDGYEEYDFVDLEDWMENRLYEFWGLCDSERILVSIVNIK